MKKITITNKSNPTIQREFYGCTNAEIVHDDNGSATYQFYTGDHPWFIGLDEWSVQITNY